MTNFEQRPAFADGTAPVVSIVYRSLPIYRLAFFEALRQRLQEHGCELRVIYGQPAQDERRKEDTGDLAWGRRVRNMSVPLGGRRLYWQPCLRSLRGSSLVIVEQASRLLLNYVLLGAQRWGGPRVAFWGHGENFQVTTASSLGEWVKRRVSRYPHWWFAYTEASAATVRALGFPAEKITVVQNAIDTTALIEARKRIGPAALERLRADLGISGRNVAVYVGGLYTGKRLDYLLQAAHYTRARVPDFELLVVGAGPATPLIQQAAARADWIKPLGPHFGVAKVPYCALAKVQLLPAIAGLAVLDAFALELPVVTLREEEHPPEFAYLVDGVNAVILNGHPTPEAYAARVVQLLEGDSDRVILQRGCRASAERYTLSAMVTKFLAGVLGALAAPAGRTTPRHRITDDAGSATPSVYV